MLNLVRCLMLFPAVALMSSAGIIVEIDSRAAQTRNDYVPWSVLGANLATFASGTSFNSIVSGISVQVATSDSSNFQHRIMGTSWTGNLNEYPNVLSVGSGFGTAGTNATFTNDGASSGPSLIFNFASSPMAGAGMQVQSYRYGAFTVTMTAYSGLNGTGSNFGSVSTAGNSDAGLPGGTNAIYLGLESHAGSAGGPLSFDIRSIVVSVQNSSQNAVNFGVNRLELDAVPEPATWTLAGLSLAVVVAARRRKQS